jgi:CHAT domain
MKLEACILSLVTAAIIRLPDCAIRWGGPSLALWSTNEVLMPQFELTVKLSEGASEPVVEARYRGHLAYSFPKRPGIEAAIRRLQTDILRDAATRRGDQNPTGDRSEENSPSQDDPGPLGVTVQEIGSLLFRYLFHGEIETLYREAEKEIKDSQDTLQVSLIFPADEKTNPLPTAPWLNLTPWETLWDDKNKEFLATAGSTFFSRAVGGALNSKPRKPPLRILIMRAAPQVFEGRRLGDLKGTVEVEKIRDALRDQECEVNIVPGESIDDLEQVLFKNDEHRYFDVFHFIGHGDFDRDKKEGYLLFRESDGAGGEPIYASYLRSLLGDPWAPQLVVLNSCSGAQGLGGDMFSSTAALLSLGEIPAVVAMQFPFTDRAAIAFSKSFYRWLGQGASVQDATRRSHPIAGVP